jgi:hypothetical protein
VPATASTRSRTWTKVAEKSTIAETPAIACVLAKACTLHKGKSMDANNSMDISNSMVTINSKDASNRREDNNGDVQNICFKNVINLHGRKWPNDRVPTPHLCTNLVPYTNIKFWFSWRTWRKTADPRAETFFAP